jgi:hypothetical protein
VVKDSGGRITNKLVGPVLKAQADAYVGACKMK